ncbi:unnamed protein product [Acanthoscelides obtectus]|uniref:Reverse transcriptase n=2 Tax=Acanthoscelides obtectus TaxID=200917 RepID=A0A9P0QJL7_ACAOB|nr:unnamed protein product [Acanthoscelides obtectus]CAH2021605.1 unnamed protein product [Acanthoscelides obtectus]CAK1686163.1 hypothetical protein AOBTE_LOCUS35822 [Acanthoscelides obtectus]CAK1687638.1 hypothetical protein AOBTE_LOCUS36307 [Acanthoscelides obtectus]
MQQEGSNNEIRDNGQSEQEQIESEQPGVDDSNDQDTEIFGILITEMGRAYAEFDGTNPLERPPLPKLKSSRKLAVVLCQLNKQILPEYLAHSNCIEQLHTLIYCAAVATVRTLGVKMPTQKITENSVKPITPKWEKRLERRTAEIRRDIGRLTQFTRGITTRKVRKQAMEIMQRLHHHSHQDATNINEWQCLDTLKQKLSVYTQRLKRYKASSHRKHDNALFQRSEKAFYRKLSSEPQEKSKTVPTKDQVEEFWGKQFGSTAYYNKCAGWITDEEAKSHYCNPMQYRAYTKQEIVDIDQVIPTNNYKRFILKNLQQSDKCRYGCQDSETIQHVTGGCQAFAPTDYKERHDIAAKIIHQELAYKFKLIECKLQYYKYTPQCVLENDKYKLYWDRTVLTDQYIKQNRPDIIIVDKDAQKQEQIESEQPGVDDSNDQDTEIFGILITEMGRAYAEFDGTNPLERPPLPKLKSSRKLAVVLCQLNKQILPEYLAHSNCIEQLHTLIYCAAVATVRTLGVKMPTQKITENSVKPITPKWEKRLERRTAEIRRDIGRLTQFTRGITTRKVRKQAMEIMQRLHHHSHQDATNINEWQCLDTLKQKLSVYTQRLKRYKASSHRKHDNALFQRSEKAFYRKLSSEPQEKSKTVPTKDQVEEFWGKQFGSTAYYNKCAGWITDEEAKSHYCNPMQYRAYTKQEIVDIDQVIPTNNYKRFILKNLQQSDKCRYGCQDSETIQHVTGGCQAFAPTDYKERHDIAAKIIHQELAYKFKLIECKLQYYKYTPQCVLENDKYKLYWDRTVLTDQYIKQNRPDIIIVDKDAQKVTLIDVAIPNSNNLTYKHNEKVAKYRELEFQIKRQWKMKYVETIPIIMSSTGVIPRRLLENIKALELSENIYKIIQKGVLLATARIVRKFMGNAST